MYNTANPSNHHRNSNKSNDANYGYCCSVQIGQTVQQSASQIAKWLCLHSKIKAVYYIGLETHPDYMISKQQTSGFGAMISFEVDSKNTAKLVLERVALIQYAESLGGVETLITYPILQTHADVPKETLDNLGVNEKLLRLSVGLENVDDLIADLQNALEAV